MIGFPGITQDDTIVFTTFFGYWHVAGSFDYLNIIPPSHWRSTHSQPAKLTSMQYLQGAQSSMQACMSSQVHIVQRNISSWSRPVRVLTCLNKCSSQTHVLFSLQQHTTWPKKPDIQRLHRFGPFESSLLFRSSLYIFMPSFTNPEVFLVDAQNLKPYCLPTLRHRERELDSILLKNLMLWGNHFVM